MRILPASIALLLLLPDEHSTVYSFTIPHPPTPPFTKCRTIQSQLHPNHKNNNVSPLQMSSSSEFDSILEESAPSTTAPSTPSSTKPPVVGLPQSSSAATLSSEDAVEEDGPATDANAPALLRDEAMSNKLTEGATISTTKEGRIEQMIRKKNERLAKKTQPAVRERASIGTMARNYVKGKDFGQLFVFTFLPAVALYYFGSRAAVMGRDKMVGKSDEMLDDYANEMIYHDGDFEEMKLCHEDYGKKLMWMGPSKGELMIKRYLEFYAKKKTVSPQAISTLSYVFQMNKFSEERAAQILSSLVESIPEKVASAGKILFFGNHIFKTEEARALLKPIEEFLASQYRDMGPGVSGAEIVRKSQIAMGEAAYRNAVANDGGKGGKKKKKTGKDGESGVEEEEELQLTIGWEVLGLTREKAQEIFDSVRDDGFRSEREKKYASLDDGITFDEKGRRVKEDGKLENPDEADPDDDKDDDGSDDGGAGGMGSVYECSDCGYTMFIAKGRDFKFFGESFKCPECGAGKDKMVGV